MNSCCVLPAVNGCQRALTLENYSNLNAILLVFMLSNELCNTLYMDRDSLDIHNMAFAQTAKKVIKV